MDRQIEDIPRERPAGPLRRGAVKKHVAAIHVSGKLSLYENCYRVVRTGSANWWTPDLFRRLVGVADSPYHDEFKHLNARIIRPAVAEVNKTSSGTAGYRR